MQSRKNIARAIAVAILLGAGFGAFAQDYPNRLVRVVIPYAPGGAAEAAARIVTQGLSEVWGKSVIIEYKPGAGGTIAAAYVAKATPDGYTLFSAYSTHFISSLVYKELPYDALKSFTPVSLVMESPQILVVPASFPARTVKELAELARSSPGKFNYGSSGAGGSQNILGEMFKDNQKIDTVHIPFKGSAEVVTAILGGQVHYSFTDASVRPQIISGKMRALALTGVRRWSALPDVPTMAEAGVAGMDSSSWNVYLAPANISPTLVNQVNSALLKVLRLPDSLERLTNAGYTPLGTSPAEAQKYYETEYAKYARIIKQMDLKPL